MGFFFDWNQGDIIFILDSLNRVTAGGLSGGFLSSSYTFESSLVDLEIERWSVKTAHLDQLCGRAIASGYFDDTCCLPSLMAPPYHIFV